MGLRPYDHGCQRAIDNRPYSGTKNVLSLPLGEGGAQRRMRGGGSKPPPYANASINGRFANRPYKNDVPDEGHF